jgi:biotin synthase
MQKNWTFQEVKAIYDQPFMDLIFQAQTIHRQNFEPNEVQISTLLNFKTGSCPENCSYCPQSAHYKTDVKKEPMMELEAVIEAAKKAKSMGSTRFCLGAAWRGPKDDDLEKVCEMVEAVKDLGLESCVTLGLLKDHQALRLKESGLDFYNHNIDTSEDFYKKIITTRVYQDRIKTLQNVRDAGIKVCCGGILGMGESEEDRLSMLMELSNLAEYPESVPINKLIAIPGTPLADQQEIDSIEFIKTIAIARIIMPKTYVRLSAGRVDMSQEMQALCFLAGANSIFYGEKLLTAKNPNPENDNKLFDKLGIKKKA